MKKPFSNSEDFFQNLSIEFLIHELKDPISIIETSAKVLLEKQEKLGTLSERQGKTMRRIARNAQQAREMLYSLLEVGRSEMGRFTCSTFDPAQAAFEVLVNCLEIKTPVIAEQVDQLLGMEKSRNYLNSCGIFFNIAQKNRQTDLFQDEVKYRQIIGNLIKNALHFRRDRVEVNIKMEGNILIVDVIDDGPGVDPEQCESIFSRYSQITECPTPMRNGHGLGLAGARTMARCLGGDVELTCDMTTGTRFRLTLPKKLDPEAFTGNT